MTMSKSVVKHRNLFQYDEKIGHAYIPNLNVRVPDGENPYFVRTNQQNFRSNFNYHQTNNSSSKRILFLGDSYVAGTGVANEKRFSDLVCSELSLDNYNFGLAGTGVDQQYLIYKNIANTYDHDLLVIAPFVTNIYRNTVAQRAVVDGYTGCLTTVPKPFFTLENHQLKSHNIPVPREREFVEEDPDNLRLYKPSAVTKKLFDSYVPLQVKAKLLRLQWRKELDGYQKANHPKWLLMRKIIEEIIALAGARKIILAPLPYYLPGMNPPFRARFIELAQEYDNVYFVDILQRFKQEPEPLKLYYKKDEHYSEYGHKIVADCITEAIKKNKLIQTNNFTPDKPVKETSKPNYILGISAFYHDSAAALLKDGKIIAAIQEERISRIKNDSQFPHKAINYCLEAAGINIEQIDGIAFYDNPYLTLERILVSQIQAYPHSEMIWEEMVTKWVSTKLKIPNLIRTKLNYRDKIYIVDHHQSHVASAYYPSPFTKAAILTVDGVGEWATATIGYGEKNQTKILKEMHYPNSIGLLYSAFTYYTGFKVNEGEYKLMGLAPYGEPLYVDLIKEHLVKIHDDGSITLNMEYFAFDKQLCMINSKFEDLFGAKARGAKEKISKHMMDVAKSIQVVTEEIIIKMASYAKQVTGADYLCMSGGVALNCVANGKLLRSNIFQDIWIQPASGDAGSALGCAYELYYSKFASTEQKQARPSLCAQKNSYWGPAYSRDEIKAYLDTYQYSYQELAPEYRNKIIAKYIAEGMIVGHFSGRVEYGPRALGNRSILADPRSEKAQSVLNLKIKFRESFRPFAPTVLEEDIEKYFELDRPSPYMLLVANVNQKRCFETHQDTEDIIKKVNQKRSDLPAITHVDYSARIQSVNQESNPVYYDLISELKKLTGYGVIINTSFNVNGEPIICTPKDAVSCFMNTNMDILVMENFILFKQEQNKENTAPKKGQGKLASLPRTSQANKLRQEARQIYSKHFPDLAPISFAPTQESAWLDVNHQQSIEIFDISRHLNSQDIIESWRVTEPKSRQKFLPLLNELISISHKFQTQVTANEEVIYDSIYVMF